MKIDQQYIKNNNIKKIYSLLRENPGTSRAVLAKTAGLSKTTVSTLIDELIQRGYVIDTGTVSTAVVGRNPNYLALAVSRHCIIAVYWEEKQMTGILMDMGGNVLARQSVSDMDYRTALHQLADILTEEKKNSYELIGMCIIMPAMIDKKSGRIISTILPLHSESDIIGDIRREFPELPLAFLNDTACYAYCEKIARGTEDETLAYINLNQGIGAALFVDGKILGNAGGTQTQFGHYSVDSKGVPCACGNRGCLEAMIGERVLNRLVSDFGGSEMLSGKQPARYQDIAEAAAKNDRTACCVRDFIADNLSKGISNLISLFRPDRIIIGGTGIDLGADFLDRLSCSIKSHGFRKMVDSVEISYSTQGRDACFPGAMRYYFDNCYSFTADMKGRIFLG